MEPEPNKDEIKELKQDDKTVDESEFIKLSPQAYTALLDKVQELEANQAHGSRTYSLEELVEEGKGKATEHKEDTKARPPDKKLEDMSRLELAQYIVNVIGDHFTPVANDLQVQIQTIRIAQDIDRCAAKYKDFWDFHEDIIRIGTENPSLSIEKAYKLAKVERGEKPTEKSEKDKTLLTLPPRPVLGDKPNAPSLKSTVPKVMTLTEAAEQAWDDVGEKE